MVTSSAGHDSVPATALAPRELRPVPAARVRIADPARARAGAPWIVLALVMVGSFSVTGAVLKLRPPPRLAAVTPREMPPPSGLRPERLEAVIDPPAPVAEVVAAATSDRPSPPRAGGDVAPAHSLSPPPPTELPEPAPVADAIPGSPEATAAPDDGVLAEASRPPPRTMERVVREEAGAVKRACAANRPEIGSAKVTLRVAVSPSGIVESATASGGGRALGRCLEDHVATWQFSAAEGPSTVEIPFYFLRQ